MPHTSSFGAGSAEDGEGTWVSDLVLNNVTRKRERDSGKHARSANHSKIVTWGGRSREGGRELGSCGLQLGQQDTTERVKEVLPSARQVQTPHRVNEDDKKSSGGEEPAQTQLKDLELEQLTKVGGGRGGARERLRDPRKLRRGKGSFIVWREVSATRRERGGRRARTRVNGKKLEMRGCRETRLAREEKKGKRLSGDRGY